MNPENADLSLLRGLKFTCLEGCAYCCLFQPDVNEEEEKRLIEKGLGQSITRSHFSGSRAIKLRGKGGACVFLKNRRCQIYPDRPHFCREFPFHTYVGYRIQIVSNLSCRGLWIDGNKEEVKGLMPVRDAESVAISHLEGVRIKEEDIRRAKELFEEFDRLLDAHGINYPLEELRGLIGLLREELSTYQGIASALEFSWEYSGEYMEAEEIAAKIRDWEPETDLKDEAICGAENALGLENLADLPVYLAEDLTWHVFQINSGKIVRHRLSEDGTTKQTDKIPLTSTPLLSPNDAGKEILMNYIDLLNARDPFYGYVAYLMGESNYEEGMVNAYIGALATSILDLLWRTSLLSYTEDPSRKKLGPREIKNGIIFYDADILDAPALGEFV